MLHQSETTPEIIVHQPETKTTNKARWLQDAIVEVRRDQGFDDTLEIADAIWPSFKKQRADIQRTVLWFAVAHMISNIRKKMDTTPEERAASRAATRAYLEAANADIRAIMGLTGLQARLLLKLPSEMLARVGDDQLISDVFKPAEIVEALGGQKA